VERLAPRSARAQVRARARTLTSQSRKGMTSCMWRRSQSSEFPQPAGSFFASPRRAHLRRAQLRPLTDCGEQHVCGSSSRLSAAGSIAALHPACGPIGGPSSSRPASGGLHCGSPVAPPIILVSAVILPLTGGLHCGHFGEATLCTGGTRDPVVYGRAPLRQRERLLADLGPQVSSRR
jgi:hypothetical protein